MKKPRLAHEGTVGFETFRNAIGVELIGVLEFTLARLLASCGVKLLPNSPNMLGEARHIRTGAKVSAWHPLRRADSSGPDSRDPPSSISDPQAV